MSFAWPSGNKCTATLSKFLHVSFNVDEPIPPKYIFAYTVLSILVVSPMNVLPR